MLVEREVKDRYLSGTNVDVPTNPDQKCELLQVNRPQKLRIRSWKGALYGKTAASYGQLYVILAVVPQGFTPGDITYPIVGGTPYDLYEPASDVLWHGVFVSTPNANGGQQRSYWEWWGDGKIIEMKSGDSLYMIADANADSFELRVNIDIDILS